MCGWSGFSSRTKAAPDNNILAGAEILSRYSNLVHLECLRKSRDDFKEGTALFGSGFPIGASSIPVGTRLWLQSLVCYTFVQQMAAE